MDLPSSRPGSPVRRRSTLSSLHCSTTSNSSLELATDSALTPGSDDDLSDVVPKVEDTDDHSMQGLMDYKPQNVNDGTNEETPRRPGRARKHTGDDGKRPIHARSKTGCGTCRKRKKKCDEARPSCANCEKNNVVCDGYEPKQPWRSSRERAQSVTSPIAPGELPILVAGVEGKVDQMFFQHFTGRLSHNLSMTDKQNPFLEIIVPMAMSHTGLMHSILYLSGSCLIANKPDADWEWQQRQEHHGSKAFQYLKEDLSGSAIQSEEDTNARKQVEDSSIAQTLVLCLQAVCVGDLSGSYRFHLDAMKTMLTQNNRSPPNEQLRQFILEFFLYHDYSSSITSLKNPLDARSISLMENFKLPEFMIQPQAGTFLGVLDGLFGFISRIRDLRDRVRERQTQNLAWWDPSIINDAFAIDDGLRRWTCAHTPGTPRYTASLLYRQSTWIYLQRTIQLSRPSATFKLAVDEGLQYLRALHGDDSTLSIQLMPLFLLGCAAFEREQRPEISGALQRLQEWSNLGNIKYARMIVEQVWRMMDEGRESETWDWETIIASRGWDFLVA